MANPGSIQSYLKRKGSPLAPFANAFVQAGARYGIDPAFLVAISGAESSFGKDRATQGIFNPFGYGPHKQFKSYPDAINEIAKSLATGPYYKTKGKTTIPTIGATWAPLGAGNDPTNLNSNWVKNVSSVYQELGGDPRGNVFQNSPSVPRNARASGIPVPVAQGTPPPAVGATGVSWSDLTKIFEANRLDIMMGRTPSPQRMSKLLSVLAKGQAGQALGLAQQQAQAVAGPQDPVTAAVNPTAMKAVKAAKTQLGVPYLWGGTDPRSGPKDTSYGLDCSGLVQYAWAQAGVNIPRVTQDQIKFGKAINPSKMGSWRPGDLIFPHAGHVAMYIGNGIAIQAPRRGTKVSYFKANTRKYIAVRRPG